MAANNLETIASASLRNVVQVLRLMRKGRALQEVWPQQCVGVFRDTVPGEALHQGPIAGVLFFFGDKVPLLVKRASLREGFDRDREVIALGPQRQQLLGQLGITIPAAPVPATITGPEGGRTIRISLMTVAT